MHTSINSSSPIYVISGRALLQFAMGLAKWSAAAVDSDPGGGLSSPTSGSFHTCNTPDCVKLYLLI